MILPPFIDYLSVGLEDQLKGVKQHRMYPLFQLKAPVVVSLYKEGAFSHSKPYNSVF